LKAVSKFMELHILNYH